MSVMHFGDEKFQRIDKTLKLIYGRDIGHVFSYPEGWDKRDGLHGHITAFLQDCQRANTGTWNRQYKDDSVLTVFAVKCVKPYRNDFELLKSLKGLRYNLVDNDGGESSLNGCWGKLDRLIDFVEDKIISAMPEWNAAQTWGD